MWKNDLCRHLKWEVILGLVVWMECSPQAHLVFYWWCCLGRLDRWSLVKEVYHLQGGRDGLWELKASFYSQFTLIWAYGLRCELQASCSRCHASHLLPYLPVRDFGTISTNTPFLLHTCVGWCFITAIKQKVNPELARKALTSMTSVYIQDKKKKTKKKVWPPAADTVVTGI